MAAEISQEQTSVGLWKAEYVFNTTSAKLADCDALTVASAKVMQRKLFLGGEAFCGGNHVALMKVPQTKDPDRAERLVREHLRYKKESLFAPVS